MRQSILIRIALSLPYVEASLKSSAAAPIEPAPSLFSAGHLRSLLQVQDVLQHLQDEHDRGNRHPSFTLAIETPNEVLEVDVIQSQPAIPPTATYSILDRPSREVGHLGHVDLVSAGGDFVLLTVNPGNGEVRGLIRKFDQDWIILKSGDVSTDVVRRLRSNENTDNRLDEKVPNGKVGNLQDSESSRQLQSLNSNYLYQINLHLDIDKTLVQSNGGSMCNVFSYINSLISAANVVLEREIMAHINVVRIRQPDFYDSVDLTDDALDRMKEEYGGLYDEDVDLHYAMLGNKLKGGLGERSGVAFVENSLCDSSRGFGVVSGLEGDFDNLDERLGTDLKRFMYAIAHSIGSGSFSGELESLLFTYGGYWSGLSDMNDINSWIDNPYLESSADPRRISYNMFRSVYDRTDNCLVIPSRSGAEEDELLAGECWPGVSFERSGSSRLSFERNSSNIVNRATSTTTTTSSPTFYPTLSPTFSPSSSPTLEPTFEPTPRPTQSKTSKKKNGSKGGKPNGNGGGKDGKASGGGGGGKDGKTSKVAAFNENIDEIALIVTEPTVSLGDGPTYFPTIVPTNTPTLEPTYEPTPSPTQSKTSKKKNDSKGGKPNDNGGGGGGGKDGKASKVASFNGDVDEIALIIAEPTISPTSYPSYLPTYSPSYFPTTASNGKMSDATISFPTSAKPNGGKASKDSNGMDDATESKTSKTSGAEVSTSAGKSSKHDDTEVASKPADVEVVSKSGKAEAFVQGRNSFHAKFALAIETASGDSITRNRKRIPIATAETNTTETNIAETNSAETKMRSKSEGSSRKLGGASRMPTAGKRSKQK